MILIVGYCFGLYLVFEIMLLYMLSIIYVCDDFRQLFDIFCD